VVQSILSAAHWFLYETWAWFWITPAPPGISKLQAVLALLSCSFIAASLLAWRSWNRLVRVFYTISAVWLGFASFSFFAACLCWAAYGAARLAGLHPNRPLFGASFLGLALLATLYGLVNAAWPRVKRITVRLPNLPQAWRGRIAALVSDIHLGHVRGFRFVQSIVTKLSYLQPDIVFIAGDVYDGTAVRAHELAAPWSKLTAVLGAYFVAGNHEELANDAEFLQAMTDSGVRVLNNEKVTVEGMQIVGVHFRDSASDKSFRAVLQNAAVDRDRASILLTHAPDRVGISEEEGISLQLSGHTHGGQFIPFTWITSRLYGKFVYGLQRLGKMLVYVSYGAGTWGPPLRVGTTPEIVLIQFE